MIRLVVVEMYDSGQAEDQTHRRHITNNAEIIMFHLFSWIQEIQADELELC